MPRNKRSETSLGGRALFQQWEALHHSPPARLYHYTTAQGLLSMIKSGHVWATESRYMNDPREFLHGAEIMLQVMNRMVKRKNPPQALLQVRGQVAAHIKEKFQNVRIFCTSFCEAGDLLSQWRGYGDSGGGYALGFESACFFGRTSSERPPLRSLLRVLYDRRQQEDLVEGWGEAVAGGRASASSPHFWRFFSEALISFKDPAYVEEGEWRLVQFGRAWSARKVWLHPVEFRERKGQIVPYADIDLSHSTGTYAGKLPISEIVHGPTQDPERSGKALRLLMEQCGYTGDQVSLRRSAVPFNK
jgi:hypothetical protein